MRFLTKEIEAPDIPERFLKKHEEGNVIFFCGAGISYSAGLPGFRELVEKTYDGLGVQQRNSTQQVAFRNHQYDVAISLLESTIPEGRYRVREQVSKILSNPIISEKSISMHKSLIALSKKGDGTLRIVTTNFDRLFECVTHQLGIKTESYIAPKLPVVNDRWNGIVYLHGLLNEVPEFGENGDLVVSSGDFGQAYLVDRWAARFLGQLFKKYSVCFIGYSLEDPVVRYMTDALAAARILGETSPEMFAFCSYKGSNEEVVRNMWDAKGVTPIPYNQKRKHSLLLKTLEEWAKTFQEGWQGKIRVINSLIGTKPSPSTAEDDFIKKMVWALSDPTGKPAEIFANANPVFDLSWLNAFSEKKYSNKDLALFGISYANNRTFDDEYTLVKRPYPDSIAMPTMTLVGSSLNWVQNDKVMYWIGSWMVRHLNNPQLLIWVSQNGGVLQQDFRRMIIQQLDIIARYTVEERLDEIDNIKATSPDAVPDDTMRSLWEIALSGKLIKPVEGYFLMKAQHYIESYGLNSQLKAILLKALSPTVIISEPTSNKSSVSDDIKQRVVRDIVDVDVVLDDIIITFVKFVENFPKWKESLPTLTLDLTILLKETMDLLKTLGKVSDDSDYSFIEIPSIDEFEMERVHNSWMFLVKMVRDSWQELAKQRREDAIRVVHLWWNYPYPLFKRLSLFAACQYGIVNFEQLVQWFSGNNRKWFWSVETQFEVLQLLKKIASRSDQAELNQVENILLTDTADEFLIVEGSKSNRDEYYEHALWLRLGVMKGANPRGLSEEADNRLTQIVNRYKLSRTIDRDNEYPIRISSEISDNYFNTELPADAEGLLIAIRENQKRGNWEFENWKSLCKENIHLVIDVLTKLYKDGFGSFQWWNSALYHWTDENIIDDSWEAVSMIVVSFPDEFYTLCSYGLGRWLKSIAKRKIQDEVLFYKLIDKTIYFSESGEIWAGDYVQSAINHPIGDCTRALIERQFVKKPKDSELLSYDIKRIFTKICTEDKEKFIYGKVILASSVLGLFRIDPQWTKEFIIPLFNWNGSRIETVAVWQGFLWNPRVNIPFLFEISDYLKLTVVHRSKLKSGIENYVRLITHIGVHKPEFITYREISMIVSQLNADELVNVADYLKGVIERAGDTLEEIWDNKLYKFFHYCWPKSATALNENTSLTIALICIKAGDIFKKVFHEVHFYISSVEYPGYVLMELEKTNLCEKFPDTSLSLISKLFGANSKLVSNTLKTCLDRLSRCKPSLITDPIFQKLEAMT